MLKPPKAEAIHLLLKEVRVFLPSFDKTITTIEGEKFIKTKDGLYFSNSDVNIDRWR